MKGHWSKKTTATFIGKKVRTYYKALKYSDARIRHIKKHILDRFIKWMSGQTVPVLKNGESGYYSHDVKRFVDLALYGTPTYFD